MVFGAPSIFRQNPVFHILAGTPVSQFNPCSVGGITHPEGMVSPAQEMCIRDRLLEVHQREQAGAKALWTKDQFILFAIEAKFKGSITQGNFECVPACFNQFLAALVGFIGKMCIRDRSTPICSTARIAAHISVIPATAPSPLQYT